MDYVQKIKEDFSDKGMYQAWGVLTNRIHGAYPTLVHPCNMKKKLLSELVPRGFKIDEVFEQIPLKQKEISRRLNISQLPSDRPSGMLGQAALFEILRNKGFGFKSYVEDFYTNWERSHLEGYVLLFTLGYLYYVRRFFGFPPIDLVKFLIEPITSYQLAIQWDQNWETRIKMNIFSLMPVNESNRKIQQVLTHLMRSQDGWGATASRIMKWARVSRAEAIHLLDIMRSSWMEHWYRIVSKNVGTVKVLTKSTSSSKIVPSLYFSCTSLQDEKDYFLSVNEVFKKDADRAYFEMEAWNTNVELYDPKDQVWRLKQSGPEARAVEEIYALLQNGDHTVPDTDILPTRNDLLFIALLTGMDTIHDSRKRQKILRWITKGYGIPKKDVENGIRNILRKNMVRNQYTHHGFTCLDREFYCITFNDKSRNVIPFLGDVLPSFPFFIFLTDTKMGNGQIFEYHPSYLSCDMRALIESSLREHDVNGEMFVVRSWGYGEPGSLLRLVPDQ